MFVSLLFSSSPPSPLILSPILFSVLACLFNNIPRVNIEHRMLGDNHIAALEGVVAGGDKEKSSSTDTSVKGDNKALDDDDDKVGKLA